MTADVVIGWIAVAILVLIARGDYRAIRPYK